MIVAYIRVSGKGQLLDDADGFPRQRAGILKLRPEVERFFEERGVTGTSDWGERPAWIEMMAALQPGDTIVIERLDRLARDLGVQEFILRDLKKRQIALLSANEPDLDDSPTRVLFRQMLGAFAQYERAMIEAKLRHARERRREQEGRCEGRKPYGQHPKRPEEVKWLHTMVQLSSQGFTHREIAEQLNSQGAPTRRGKPWHHGSVGKILSAQLELPAAATLPAVAGVPPSEACAPGSH